MDTTVLPAICPAYVDKLSLYYSKIISHAITGDGKYLLALIKSGSLALFPLKKYLTDFILKKAGDLTTEESIVDPNRLKPIQLISVANFLCLALDPSSNCFVLGGKGKKKVSSFEFPLLIIVSRLAQGTSFLEEPRMFRRLDNQTVE